MEVSRKGLFLTINFKIEDRKEKGQQRQGNVKPDRDNRRTKYHSQGASTG